MKFANYIRYIEDQNTIAAIRPTHRAYLHGLLERGQLAAAGPFADGSGALFIYEADNIEAARALAEADPYTLGGAIKQQTITPWTLVYSNPSLLQQPET
ncbi:MAG TPA: YciI family protein [Trebonia sp.]